MSSPIFPTSSGASEETEALARNVESLFARIIALVPYLPDELQLAAANTESPSGLANLIATVMRLKTEEKQELLEEADVEARLRKLSAILNARARGLRARHEDPVAGPVGDGEGRSASTSCASR